MRSMFWSWEGMNVHIYIYIPHSLDVSFCTLFVGENTFDHMPLTCYMDVYLANQDDNDIRAYIADRQQNRKVYFPPPFDHLSSVCQKYIW